MGQSNLQIRAKLVHDKRALPKTSNDNSNFKYIVGSNLAQNTNLFTKNKPN